MMLYRFIISGALLIGLLLPASAQTQKEARAARKAMRDSVKLGPEKYIPTGIRIGYDISSLVNTLARKEMTAIEIAGDIDIDRYILNLDIGYQSTNRVGDSFTYSNDGTYFKIGPDVNFNYRDKARSALFLGLRFAASNFGDEMDYIVTNPVWGDTAGRSSNTGVNANWFEGVVGMKVKVFHQVFLGYTFRIKFAKSLSKTEELAPFEIPGWGKVINETEYGFNYYVFYRFKLREVIVPEKKK